MAFERQPAITDVSIGDVRVELFDPDPAVSGDPLRDSRQQSAVAIIEVRRSDGSARTVRANIAEHFPPTTVNQLKAFVASVRTKAIAEIL